MAVSDDLRIFTGNANPALAKEIAGLLGARLSPASVGRFSDGEINVVLEESVRGKDVFVIQPTCPPSNDNVMELAILLDAAKRASARKVTAIVPYYGYARQDRTVERGPITARLIADLITNAGADAFLSVDLHSASIEGFFDMPIDNLSATWLFGEYFASKGLAGSGVVVVSPDVGGVKRARNLARLLDAGLAIIDKQRPKPNASEVMNVIGSVKGKTCILVDDLIDTAGTLVLAADALVQHGATEVYACATHPVLSGPANERLAKSRIKQVIVTNSIPLRKGAPAKIKQLSLAPLLSEAIKRIHEHKSISELFKFKAERKQKTL